MRIASRRLGLAILVALSVWSTSLRAQDNAVSLLEHAALQYAEGYAQPLGNMFSAIFNSSQYHTAAVGGLHVYASVQVLGALVPESDKTFSPTFVLPLAGHNIPRHFDNVPTILGGQTTAYLIDTVLDGQQYQIPLPPGIDQKFIPLVVPHIEIGTFLNTEVILRGIPSIQTNSKIGSVSFYGLGLRHSLSNYVPFSPIDVSVQIMYQHLGAGDVASMNAWNAAALASFSLPGITVYGGLQAEKAAVSLHYTVNDPSIAQPVNLTFNSTNNMRVTIGATLKLWLLYINAQGTFAQYPTAGVGVGLNIPPTF